MGDNPGGALGVLSALLDVFRQFDPSPRFRSFGLPFFIEVDGPESATVSTWVSDPETGDSLPGQYAHWQFQLSLTLLKIYRL